MIKCWWWAWPHKITTTLLRWRLRLSLSLLQHNSLNSLPLFSSSASKLPFLPSDFSMNSAKGLLSLSLSLSLYLSIYACIYIHICIYGNSISYGMLIMHMQKSQVVLIEFQENGSWLVLSMCLLFWVAAFFRINPT